MPPRELLKPKKTTSTKMTDARKQELRKKMRAAMLASLAAAKLQRSVYTDPVTLETHSRRRGGAMNLNKMTYHKDTIQELVDRGNFRVPHSRRELTTAELTKGGIRLLDDRIVAVLKKIAQFLKLGSNQHVSLVSTLRPILQKMPGVTVRVPPKYADIHFFVLVGDDVINVRHVPQTSKSDLKGTWAVDIAFDAIDLYYEDPLSVLESDTMLMILSHKKQNRQGTMAKGVVSVGAVPRHTAEYVAGLFGVSPKKIEYRRHVWDMPW